MIRGIILNNHLYINETTLTLHYDVNIEINCQV